MLEWFRFALTAVLLTAGLVFFAGAVLGNCRFFYVMNRVHAAGLGDTMGLLLVLLALAVSAGSVLEIGKLFLPLLFLWCSSPVSSHFLSQIEYYTNQSLYDHMDRLGREKGEGHESR